MKLKIYRYKLLTTNKESDILENVVKKAQLLADYTGTPATIRDRKHRRSIVVKPKGGARK